MTGHFSLGFSFLLSFSFFYLYFSPFLWWFNAFTHNDSSWTTGSRSRDGYFIRFYRITSPPSFTIADSAQSGSSWSRYQGESVCWPSSSSSSFDGCRHLVWQLSASLLFRADDRSDGQSDGDGWSIESSTISYFVEWRYDAIKTGHVSRDLATFRSFWLFFLKVDWIDSFRISTTYSISIELP